MFLIYFAFAIGKIVLAYRAYRGIETNIPFVTPYVKSHLGKPI
jgi:hypothetical protein